MAKIGPARARLPGLPGFNHRPVAASKRSRNASSPVRRPIRSLARPQHIHRRGVWSTIQIGPPIRVRFSQQMRGDPEIAPQSKMMGSAAPSPTLGSANEPGAHGIEFHIPHRFSEMGAVHRYGGEPPLPEMAGPPMGAVDAARIAAMDFAERQMQRVGSRRDSDEMESRGGSFGDR